MSELITEEQPRIKYSTRFVGPLRLPPSCPTTSHGHASHDYHADHHAAGPSSETSSSPLAPLAHLSRLMHRMEQLGAAPILNDGQVAGNCAISPALLSLPSSSAADAAAATAAEAPTSPPPPPPPPSPPAAPLEGLALVSMSGKPPGHVLDPAADFVLVTEFDRTAWAAAYRSRDPAVRPSSDSPLLVAALARGREYGWDEMPYVVLHGHALADGEGLSYAESLGLPISGRATLFSTPEDLGELEGLFAARPYPAHACYIRRGHGFFLLGRSVAEAEAHFDRLIVPWLEQQQQQRRQQQQQQQARDNGA